MRASGVETEGAAARIARGLAAPAGRLLQLRAILPELATGVRAAVATIVPYSLAGIYQRPELAWMALGGWLGTLTDPGGSRRARARVLLAFALLGSLLVAACETAARLPLLAMLLLTAIVFSVTLLRALGAAAQSLGTMLCIVAAVASAKASGEPLRDALRFAAGGAVALVLSTVIWPVWTHWPVRRAIGQVLKELAAYLDALGACVLAGTPAGDPRWMQLGRLHPRRIRDALEAARAIALAIHTRRAGESRTGGNLRVLLGLLESQFLLMVTLASELESLPPGARAVAPDWFAHGAAACEAIRAQLLSRAWRRHARPAAPTPLPAAKDNLAHLLAALEEESARSLLLVSSLDQAVPLQAAEPSAALQVSVRLELRLLADALSIRSPIFRHALRVAIAAAAASLLGAAVSPHHAAWVTVTALVVLQPFSGATVRRAVERTAGTVLGGMVALALTALTARPFALALIMFPLSVAAVVTRRRSYPLFTFFLTPIFVLIATRDSGDWWVAAIRSGDTVLGGAIALATSLLVFRGVDERTGLSNALERMVRAATAYSESALASLAAGEVAQGQLPERRRAAALAISDAEAALERRLAEPLRRGENDERAVELVTYTRRLTMASTTLVTMDARGLLEERSRQELVGRVEQFAQLVRSAAGQLAPGAA